MAQGALKRFSVKVCRWFAPFFLRSVQGPSTGTRKTCPGTSRLSASPLTNRIRITVSRTSSPGEAWAAAMSHRVSPGWTTTRPNAGGCAGRARTRTTTGPRSRAPATPAANSQRQDGTVRLAARSVPTGCVTGTFLAPRVTAPPPTRQRCLPPPHDAPSDSCCRRGRPSSSPPAGAGCTANDYSLTGYRELTFVSRRTAHVTHGRGGPNSGGLGPATGRNFRSLQPIPSVTSRRGCPHARCRWVG